MQGMFKEGQATQEGGCPMKWSENLDHFIEELGPVCIANAESRVDFDDDPLPNEMQGLGVVTIRYIKEDPDHTINSVRRMIPIHMFETQAGYWCFKAYCLRDLQPKYFRLDRINEVKVRNSGDITTSFRGIR